MRYIIAFTFLLTVSACKQKQNDSNSTFTKAEFNIDSNLLSDQTYKDSTLNISISVPLNWGEADKSTKELIHKQLKVINVDSLSIKEFFIDSLSGSLMTIIDISTLDSSFINSLKYKYDSMLNSKLQWQHIQFSEFIIKHWHVQQYVLQNERAVMFKLLFIDSEIPEFNQPFEIDYILANNTFQKNIKSVESSIGSIQLFNLNTNYP
jgi:hypothetical protein